MQLPGLFREPLVQFAFGGALVFGVHATLPSAPPPLSVVVAPDADDAARRDAVDRAVLVAEARRRGLDFDDVIVRRRLEQKMRFALEGVAAVDDEDLRRQRDAHPDRYRLAPRVDLVHVFADGTRRSDAEAVATRWRAELAAGDDVAGDPFLHGRRIVAADPATLAERFGEGFATAVANLDVGTWTVVESSFGWHVVAVQRRRAGTLPEVDALRERLRADVVSARRAEQLRIALDRLRTQYDVRVEEAAR